MKSPHLKADPAVTVDRSAHATDANQTWSDPRGETTEPGPPPRLDPSTGLGRDDDGRTQPDLIGPGGKLVGFGGLRPDVRVQAESAGRSAARYDAKAAPARSVLPMEADTSRRIVVNQTQPMGLPIVPNQPVPDSVTVPIAAPVAPATPASELAAADPLDEATMPGADGDDAASRGGLPRDAGPVNDPRLARLVGVSSADDTYVPFDGTHADGNDTVPRARQPKARRMWLAASAGVGIAILIALSIVVFANNPPTTTTSPSGGSTSLVTATATGTTRQVPSASVTPAVVESSSAPSALTAAPAPSIAVAAPTASASLPASTRVPTVASPSSPRSPTSAPPSAPRQPAPSSAAPPPTVTPTSHAPAQPPDPAPKNDIDRTLRP